ncbi:MAG: hypothetical protein AAFR38_09720 [Planctomycetota bacterium]
MIRSTPSRLVPVLAPVAGLASGAAADPFSFTTDGAPVGTGSLGVITDVTNLSWSFEITSISFEEEFFGQIETIDYVGLPGLEASALASSGSGAVGPMEALFVQDYSYTAPGQMDPSIAFTVSFVVLGGGDIEFNIINISLGTLPAGGDLNLPFSLSPSEVTFSGSVSVIPTPSGTVVLGIGGLVAARRRR